ASRGACRGLPVGAPPVAAAAPPPRRANPPNPAGAALTRRQAARLLAGAGQAAHVGDFLPAPPIAEADEDIEALNLLAGYFVGLHARENKLAYLEQAWGCTEAAPLIKPMPDQSPELE